MTAFSQESKDTQYFPKKPSGLPQQKDMKTFGSKFPGFTLI